MGILRCKEAFAVTDKDGAAVVYAPGDLVDEKNKWVKGRESLFESVEASAERTARPKTERATAGPDEKRHLSVAQVHEQRGEANPQEGDDEDDESDEKPAKKAAAKKSTKAQAGNAGADAKAEDAS